MLKFHRINQRKAHDLCLSSGHSITDHHRNGAQWWPLPRANAGFPLLCPRVIGRVKCGWEKLLLSHFYFSWGLCSCNPSYLCPGGPACFQAPQMLSWTSEEHLSAEPLHVELWPVEIQVSTLLYKFSLPSSISYSTHIVMSIIKMLPWSK